MIHELLQEGHGLNETSRALNRLQILTARGCKWTANAVSRIIQRLHYALPCAF